MEEQQKFRSSYERKGVILYIDLKGSTKYKLDHPDLEGIFHVYRFTDIISDIIEKKSKNMNNKIHVIKYVGDAVIAYGEGEESCRSALVTALHIVNILDSQYKDTFKCKIGISYGTFYIINYTIIINNKSTKIYDILGLPVDMAKKLSDLADQGNQILISKEVFDNIAGNEFKISAPIEIKISGSNKEIYEVVPADSPYKKVPLLSYIEPEELLSEINNLSKLVNELSELLKSEFVYHDNDKAIIEDAKRIISAANHDVKAIWGAFAYDDYLKKYFKYVHAKLLKRNVTLTRIINISENNTNIDNIINHILDNKDYILYGKLIIYLTRFIPFEIFIVDEEIAGLVLSDLEHKNYVYFRSSNINFVHTLWQLFDILKESSKRFEYNKINEWNNSTIHETIHR